MIKCLDEKQIELEVDPNENGYPVLLIQIKLTNTGRMVTLPLGIQATTELIKELQAKLTEIS